MKLATPTAITSTIAITTAIHALPSGAFDGAWANAGEATQRSATSDERSGAGFIVRIISPAPPGVNATMPG